MSGKEFPISQGTFDYSDRLHEQMVVRTREPLIVSAESLDEKEAVSTLSSGRSVVNVTHREMLNRVTDFEPFPDKVVEEARSAHHVAFGRLVGRRSTGNRRHGHLQTIAMKPFLDPHDAVTEVRGYWTLQGLGIETFNPVGIFPTENSEAFIVITEKRNDLMSLDRDDWVVGRQVHSEAEAEVATRNTQTVKDIAATMAWMNANGVFHPDGQIKNYAITDFGQVGVIDTENLFTLPIGHDDTVPHVVDSMTKLLRSLVSIERDGKMFGVGMLAGMSPDQLRNCFEELILRPYCEFLEDAYYEGKIDGDQAQLLIDGVSHMFSVNVQNSFAALASA